jgi:hypothetical protein
MTHFYAKQKLGSAVRSMASDPGDIKERLWHAYQIFHALNERYFSDELKEDWTSIYQRLTTEPESYNANGEVTTGRVQNTLAKLDAQTCVNIAQSICELESKASNEYF